MRFVRLAGGGSQTQTGGGSSLPGGPANLSGAWRANIFGQSVSYKITQSGNNFHWNASHFGETASGTINGNNVTASVSNQFGNHPPATGTVKLGRQRPADVDRVEQRRDVFPRPVGPSASHAGKPVRWHKVDSTAAARATLCGCCVTHAALLVWQGPTGRERK